MKITCEYCGNTYEDTKRNCPSCGAANPTQNDADNRPKTIEELAEWYAARNLPPYEVTRFFIGQDIKEAKAFGIYKKPNGDVVLYKNKADGTRAVRYEGDDEEYAVHELFQKLKDEIVHQKNKNKSAIPLGNSSKSGKSGKGAMWKWVAIILVVCGLFSYGKDAVKNKNNAYYRYNDQTYYRYQDNWYYFDDNDNDWDFIGDAALPPDFSNHLDDYYYGKTWNSELNASDFDESSWYKDSSDSSSSSSSSDSDYDWGSDDDWDSDWGSDWDSDW